MNTNFYQGVLLSIEAQACNVNDYQLVSYVSRLVENNLAHSKPEELLSYINSMVRTQYGPQFKIIFVDADLQETIEEKEFASRFFIAIHSESVPFYSRAVH
jgi:hypothetical protein